METLLKSRLDRVIRRYQHRALYQGLTVSWLITALVGAVLSKWPPAFIGSPAIAISLLAVLAAVLTGITLRLTYRRQPDRRDIARKIETKHPELEGSLVTLVQTTPPEATEPDYLRFRLLQSILARGRDKDWRDLVPRAHLIGTHAFHLVALATLAFIVVTLRNQTSPGPARPGQTLQLSVTPGDTEIEKGDTLVVLARFGAAPPAAAQLVIHESGAAPRTVPLIRSLADPVFGGSVADVGGDFTYHVEYGNERTRDFRVTVFEHPRLERADAQLAFPDYTQLPPKRIENTRRLSAVEGTQLELALQLNKPVAQAQLVARDAAKTVLPLDVSPERASANLAGLTLQTTQTYDLRLVDADGRANKLASSFVIEVLPNRPPELRLTAPRGDARPSPLEEVAFAGTVWDDFGTPTYGITYTVVGSEPQSIELGAGVAGRERRAFAHMLKLEELSVEPDQLISWYAWAEDVGPDGQARRTTSDLFFGEVRPFEEIFRENQEMNSASAESGGPPGGGGQQQQLVELQKQIITATWNLQRDPAKPTYAADAKVLHDSQAEALAQASAAREQASAPRERGTWTAVTQEMEQALAHLNEAANTPTALAQALPAEQSAYQKLLSLQNHENSVSRNRNRGQGQGSGQANQRQLDQLDLQQSENRYETQRQARSLQSPERRESLQVTNRLQELARRQQDWNERLQELQTALQAARTEAEREEVRRQLKRLQEEQQQMLADLDQVRQRMDRAENQSRMNEERQQLEQTRDAIQRAAEAAAEGSVAQALAAGTRAQRQLQDLRDQMRQQNSSQFSEDLREMRQDVRELAREQEALSQELASAGGNQRQSLRDDNSREQLLDRLTQQRERLNEVVQRAQTVSEQAESTEPLVSRHLYDSLRKLAQDDANVVNELQQNLLRRGQMTRSMYQRLQEMNELEGGRALALTAEMLKEDQLLSATEAEQRARAGIAELRRGVERAAERVLGDDAEALRLAQSEIDELTEQLRREFAPGEATASNEGAAGAAGAPQATADAASRTGSAGERSPDEGDPRPGDPQGEQGEPRERTAGELADSRGRADRGSEPGDASQPGRTGEQGEGSRAEAGEGTSAGGPAASSVAEASGQEGRGEPAEPGAEPREARLADGSPRPSAGGPTAGGGNGRGFDLGSWLDRDIRLSGSGPLTGEDFATWVDRLREVEDMLDVPELRDAVASARERARALRREYTQERQKPDWAVVQLQVVAPLIEVRRQIREELARRDTGNDLVPIDRDPVPNRFAEQVRRYYEELGRAP